MFCQALEAVEHHQGRILTVQVDFDVFAHSLYIADPVHLYGHGLVIGLEAENLLLRLRRRGLAAGFHDVAHFVGLFPEFRQAEGLHQIAHGVDPEAFQGIFGIGGGENHERRLLQRAHELQSGDIRHIDIHEEDIGRGNIAGGLPGRCTGGQHLQIRQLGCIQFQLAQGQGFVVQKKGFNHTAASLSGITSNTLKRPPSCPVSN